MTSSPPPASDNGAVGISFAGDTATAEPSWRTRLRQRVDRSIALQATIALGAVLVLFLLVFYGFAVMYTHPVRWWPWSGTGEHGTASLYDLTRNSATVAALLGGAVAIAVALRRQRSTERTVELTEETAQVAAETARIAQDSVMVAQETASITAQAYQLDQSRAAREEIDRLRDRYTTISSQLGHDAAPVRLAGVYAMAALADDWLKREAGNHEAQVCIDVLCAYVRTPRHDATGEERLADTRVRETITRVIAAHLQPDANSSWSGKSFDFSNSTFEGTHSFSRAKLYGSCQMDFAGAKFNKGCRVNFNLAEFERACRVNFNNAQFEGGCQLSLYGTKFEQGSQMDFADAKFDQGCLVNFFKVEFKHSCEVSFSSAEFNHGCEVLFDGSRFEEGGKIAFAFAVFDTGCRVNFAGSKLKERCHLNLDDSQFNEGCQVSFSSAEFESDCRVTFCRPFFNDGWPTGPWGNERPPECWPIP